MRLTSEVVIVIAIAVVIVKCDSTMGGFHYRSLLPCDRCHLARDTQLFSVHGCARELPSMYIIYKGWTGHHELQFEWLIE